MKAEREAALSAWRFTALPTKATIALSERERIRAEGKLDDLVGRIAHFGLDDSRLLTEVEIAARTLPHRLLDRLIRFRVTGNHYGTFLIRNLPVGSPLPPTPACGRISSWSAVARSTLMQLAIMSVLGQVIAYADEQRGALIQDMCPSHSRADGRNSLPKLRTSQWFHPFKPEIISLACLRADHERTAATVTGSIRSVLPLLPEPIVRALREPIYRFRFSTSPPRPVLSGSDDDPDLSVDFDEMESIRPAGATALEALRETMQIALIGVILEPGDMLVVDNRIAVHGQAGFVPRCDGADRWLRRCFAVADLWPSREARHPASRVCRPTNPGDSLLHGI